MPLVAQLSGPPSLGIRTQEKSEVAAQELANATSQVEASDDTVDAMLVVRYEATEPGQNTSKNMQESGEMVDQEPGKAVPQVDSSGTSNAPRPGSFLEEIKKEPPTTIQEK